MKRSAALTQLSREHHTALVLAKRAQRLARGAPADAEAFMEALGASFAEELEPHFQVEEASLLVALDNAGDIERVRALTQRTRADHEALRELAQRIGRQDFASLGRFGELLDAHVRFEERELFNVAESVLSPQALADVEAADARRKRS